LRRDGIIPGVLYGPDFEPINVQMPWTDLRLALRDAGGSSILELKIDGESYSALVRNVHRAPVTGAVQHVDFYRVRMDVEIHTDVRITLVGESKALEAAGGMVMQEMNTVELQCLPANLPAHIEVDVTGLTEIGQSILVSDLPALEGVRYMADPHAVVAAASYATAPQVVEEGEGAATAEPELIRRERAEEEED